MVFNQGDLSRFKQLQMIILYVTLVSVEKYWGCFFCFIVFCIFAL